MAEGGGDPQDNPFSFKKFVKKQTGSNSPTSENEDKEEEEDALDLPDLGVDNNNGKERFKAHATEDEKVKKREKGGENPFSFKKFLKGGARPKTGPGSGASGLATLDLANDLPDFVQDHFSGDFQNRRTRNQPEVPLPDFGASRAPSDIPLPDFALDSSSSKPGLSDLPLPSPSPEEDIGFGLLLDSGPRPRVNRTPDRVPVVDLGIGPFGNEPGADPVSNDILNDIDDDDDDDDDSAIEPISVANTTGGLPDFLSDSAVNKPRALLDNSQASSDDMLYHHMNGDIDLELRRLREENRELRRQLEDSRQFADTESKRVAKVVQEMESIQKKEAEDTTALENMMQQVEANLQLTMQRAVQAEKTVTKLKQEVKSLQSQVKRQETENQALRVGQGAPDMVREKAKYASQQLSVAAKTAEQRLKELMGGVETLKLVSEVLASIDKITEEGATGATSTEGNLNDGDSGATGGSSS